jgi:primase-polymerase (primpol)-like protein
MNPFTWTDYEDAASSTAGVGLGFVLNGDGVVCLDVDHCVTDGVPDVWVRGLLSEVAGTYVELSPSGTGLHIWGTASLSFGGRVVSYGPGFVEIYGSGRYLTVTGSALNSSRDLKPIGRVIRKLLS